jgi:hypothetical protein
MPKNTRKPHKSTAAKVPVKTISVQVEKVVAEEKTILVRDDAAHRYRLHQAEALIRDFLKRQARKGGKARAKKYDKETLSRWARKGGRPKKKKGVK